MYSGLDPEEALYRDYKQSPLLAPFLLNLPKLSQLVPEKPSPVKTERLYKGEPVQIMGRKIPAGIFRQVTGLSKRTKTLMEREVDSLGLSWTRIIPRTGVPEADRKLSRYMAPIVERFGPMIIKTPNYKKLSIAGKRIALAELFKDAREQARKRLTVEDPRLALKTSIRGMAKDIQTVLKEK